MKQNRPGRPSGFKMNKQSKRAISKTKTGFKHTQETKDKIKAGVKREHHTGAPIELIMETDLEKAHKIQHHGYVNVYIPNPIKGVPGYHVRYSVALMEKHLGKKMENGEQVHHLGSKDMNEIRLFHLCANKVEHILYDKFKARQIKKHGSKRSYYEWLDTIC